MFTSSIISKSFFNGDLKVEVEFTDGTSKWTESMVVRNAIDLNQKIKNRLETLNEQEQFFGSITTGTYHPTDTPIIAPTQATLDKSEWFRDFNRLERIQKLIDLGALTGTEAAIVNLLNKVKSNFKPAYISDM